MATLVGTGGNTYFWFNTGETTPTITVAPDTTTTYYLSVVSPNGCPDDTSVTVTVQPVPNADAGPDQIICEGETATLVRGQEVICICGILPKQRLPL
jgi:hypothetical protein